MKFTYLALLLAVLAAGQVSAAAKTKNITSAKVYPVEYRDPEYAYTQKVSAPSTLDPKAPAANGWMVIQVDYQTRYEKNSAPIPEKKDGKIIGVKFPAYMDDLQLNVRVLVDTGLVDKGKPVYVLITGKVVFDAVYLDGYRHTALLFMEPRLLDKYTCSWRLRSKGKRACKVEAVFTWNGEELARVYQNVHGKKEQQQKDFEALCKEVPPVLTLNGALLPKSQSPWRFYRPSMFDLEKVEIK